MPIFCTALQKSFAGTLMTHAELAGSPADSPASVAVYVFFASESLIL